MKKHNSYLVLILLFIISFMTFTPGGQALNFRPRDGMEHILVLRFYPYYSFSLLRDLTIIPFVIFIVTILLILLNVYDNIKPYKHTDKIGLISSGLLIVLAIVQMIIQGFKHITLVNILIPIVYLVLIGLILVEDLIINKKNQ